MLNLDENRKQAVINAALKEFAIKGYDNASTNQIAKNAKMSKGLMFHYTNNKETLFLYLIAYCQEKIDQNYLRKMNFKEKDILKRLHQSYLLQLELIKKNPWILDFIKLPSNTKSEKINQALQEKVNQEEFFCFETMFNTVDETKFRKDLDVEKCKQLIFWGNIGFIGQIINDLRNVEFSEVDYIEIVDKLDNYFNDLISVFYTSK